MPKIINPRFNNLNIPKDIKPPFPLKIRIHDLLPKSGNNKRIPNAFIIYRKSLNHELISNGYKISLKQVSTMASKAWKDELDEVKQAYINLVNEAKVLYKGLQLSNSADNAMTFINQIDDQNLNTLNTVAQLHSEMNTFDDYSFNDLITENNNSDNNINERVRLLEERQKFLAEYLGFILI
jgi:hypothetical protein